MVKDNLYKIGKDLGLNKNDIDNTLKCRFINDETTSLSVGPGDYDWGTLYGTVSIYDF